MSARALDVAREQSTLIRAQSLYEDSPTLQRFADCDARVRGIMGPVGSGKSSACCWEVFRRAMGQAPGRDGVRRTRFAVVRNTDKELLDTTIKTWFEWFPSGIAGTWHSTNRTFWLRVKDTSGKLVAVSEVMFRAMDIPKQVRDLLSLELTGAWINEAREIEEEIYRGLLNKGRLGRYPSQRDGGATWSGLWMDTNPPDDLSWWYRVFEEEELDNPEFVLFRQPSGRSDAAENRSNLPADYYEQLLSGSTDQYVRVYVDAEYGTVEEGKPIYAGQWSDKLHVSPVGLWPMKRRAIAIGFDFGLAPSAVIAQITPRGQLRILDEVVGTDMGVRQLVRAGLKPLLGSKYKGLEIERVIGDPSGATKDPSDSENSPFKVLEEEGFDVEAAPSNDPRVRWEWVRYWLTQLRDGHPALLLDPGCRQLRRGFNGRYKFRRLQVSGPDKRYSDKADKNETSHPHDALQYLCSAYVPEERRRHVIPIRQYIPASRIAGI